MLIGHVAGREADAGEVQRLEALRPAHHAHHVAVVEAADGLLRHDRAAGRAERDGGLGPGCTESQKSRKQDEDPHPFTAPAVSPSMTCREAKKKRMSSGTTARAVPRMTTPQSVFMSPCKELRASGSV